MNYLYLLLLLWLLLLLFLSFSSFHVPLSKYESQITGVSMQSVLVGSDLDGCAFVYGSLSFLDKVSCGLAVFVLQSFQSKSSPTARPVLIFYSQKK